MRRAPRTGEGALITISPMNVGDVVFKILTRCFALVIIVLVLVIFFEMLYQSRLSIAKFGLSFIVRSVWDPVNEQYGALPFIYGTLVSSFLALIIALPLGVGVAVFLSELAPPWL